LHAGPALSVSAIGVVNNSSGLLMGQVADTVKFRGAGVRGVRSAAAAKAGRQFSRTSRQMTAWLLIARLRSDILLVAASPPGVAAGSAGACAAGPRLTRGPCLFPRATGARAYFYDSKEPYQSCCP
jgi:hypothetical protein